MHSSTTPVTPGSVRKPVVHESDRNVIIYTGFAALALVLLGAFVYHFSGQLLR
ncbi:MAG TPA: hypothetical protein VG892_09560 [Terriglobales bacterium]|jgi:hypothetical protein|nr:hypothetical protein [Terriglobales bacterium]